MRSPALKQPAQYAGQGVLRPGADDDVFGGGFYAE